MTLLTFAANKGHVDCCRDLITKGLAVVDEHDGGGDFALCLAARAFPAGRADLVRVLVTELGADVNMRDSYGGHTARFYAKKRKFADMEALLEALGGQLEAADAAAADEFEPAGDDEEEEEEEGA